MTQTEDSRYSAIVSRVMKDSLVVVLKFLIE
jgi:hypothetical protein